MTKYDYRWEGRNNPTKVTIIDERGEDSTPKSLQVAPRELIRTLRKPCRRGSGIGPGPPGRISDSIERNAYLRASGSGGRPEGAPSPWTPKSKREPSSESFREKQTNKVRPGTRKQSLAQASETLQVNPTKYKQIEPHPIEPTLMTPNQIIPNQTESHQSELKRNESDQHKYASKAMAIKSNYLKLNNIQRITVNRIK